MLAKKMRQVKAEADKKPEKEILREIVSGLAHHLDKKMEKGERLSTQALQALVLMFEIDKLKYKHHFDNVFSFIQSP